VARPELEGFVPEPAEVDAVFESEGMVLADGGDQLLLTERLGSESIGQRRARCKREVESPIRQKRWNIAAVHLSRDDIEAGKGCSQSRAELRKGFVRGGHGVRDP